jgi:glycosyltransferase involved in cell wall biosynthesis
VSKDKGRNMPAVTIIIPTFNREQFLKEAVDSVLSQTYDDFELIVVDDGSTDKTKKMLQDYGQRLTYIFQENRGVGTARNRGIAEAKGELISFLDSDDLWKRDKLSIQTDLMKSQKGVMISFTDEIWIRKGVRVNPMKKHQKHSGRIYEKCLPLCIISPSSVMIRRELFDTVGLFDETLSVCEDYDLWLRISSRYPVFFIDKKLIVKRGGHPDQLSNRSWGNDRFRVTALLKMLKGNYLDEKQKQITEQELIRKCRVLVNGYLKRGNIEQGNRYKALMEKYGEGGKQ